MRQKCVAYLVQKGADNREWCNFLIVLHHFFVDVGLLYPAFDEAFEQFWGFDWLIRRFGLHEHFFLCTFLVKSSFFLLVQ